MPGKQLIVALVLGVSLTSVALLILDQPATVLASRALYQLPVEIIVNPGASIQAAIDAANPGDTIVVQAGIYTESLTVSKAITLTGVSSATAIIRAVVDQRVLTVTGMAVDNTVVVSGLTIADGDVTGGDTGLTQYGGGILVSGMAQLLLQNVIITNNRAILGGGLYADTESFLTLKGTEFFSNTATSFGGGAATFGPTVIIGGRFKRNKAGDSGGGLIVANTLSLNLTEFFSNTALGTTGVGGGLGIVGRVAAVTDGHFEGNMAGFTGGGIYASSNSTLTLRNTAFISNTAPRGGGLVAFAPVTVTGGRFERNTATDEGGGLNAQKALILNKTEFISNTATRRGGGVIVFGPAMVSRGRFDSNRAHQLSGGGLFANSSLTLNSTEFIRNTANNFGGGAIAFGAAMVSEGYFEGNAVDSDGGGLNAQGTLTLSDTTFINNRAGVQGGGASTLEEAMVTGGRFERNTAGTDGGGLYTQDMLILTGTTFISNVATDGVGGGTTVLGAAIITGGHFERNVAKLDGGGLNAQDILTLDNTTFANNQANLSGGGAIAFGAATVTNNRFEGNIANVNGGGLYASATLTLRETDFINNTSLFDGGGVVTVGVTKIIGGHFEHNRCTRVNLDCTGGGLLVSNRLVLTRTSFLNNSAAIGGGLAHFGNSEVYIGNTLFARNKANEAGAGLVFDTSDRVTLLHTTITDNNLNFGQAIAIFNGTVGITNVLITNHVIGISQTGGIVLEDYNLFYNTAIPKAATVTSGGHSLIDDPKFIDPTNDDYRLGEGSAAIDRGVDVGITIDLDGNARPQGNGFDIGAYEKTSGKVYLPLIFRDTP